MPAGARHNVRNIGSAPLRFYTIYGPPEHIDQLVEATKADACKFFNAYYAPDRAVMVVTGNFDPTQLSTWGLRIFNGTNGIKATAKEASISGFGSRKAWASTARTSRAT